MESPRVNETLRANAAANLLVPDKGNGCAEGGFSKGDRVVISNPDDCFDGRRGIVDRVVTHWVCKVNFSSALWVPVLAIIICSALPRCGMPNRPTIVLQVDARHAQTAVRLARTTLRDEIADGASIALAGVGVADDGERLACQ